MDSIKSGKGNAENRFRVGNTNTNYNMKLINTRKIATAIAVLLLSGVSGLVYAQPANNECSGATSISLLNTGSSCLFTTAGTTVNATASANPMSCWPVGTYPDVWYRFTAAAATHVIQTNLSTGSVGVILYSGTCTGLTQVYCGGPNTPITGLTVGTQYYLRIITGSPTAFNVCVSRTSVPPCTTNLTPANNATDIPLNPHVGFSWNAVAGATNYTICVLRMSGDTAYTGSTTLTSHGVYGLSPDSTYKWYIVPRNAVGNAAGCSSNMSTFTMADTVINDNCANAISVNSVGVQGASTIGATQSQVACVGTATSDIWYKTTPPSAGNVSITVTPTNNGDAVLEVFSGTCGNLTSMSCVNVNGVDGEEVYTIVAAANTTYYFRVYDFAGTEKRFTLQVAGTPLPLGMDKLAGRITEGDKVLLNWKTLKEENINGFEIQRSQDGYNFRVAGYVNSKAINGNSDEIINYDFKGAEPVNDVVYYRIQQIDINGINITSNTIRLSANSKGAFEMLAVPNPVKHKLNLKTYGVRGDNAQVVVTDLSGKIVHRFNIINAETDIDMSSVANGIYLLKYTDATRTQTIKISKQ